MAAEGASDALGPRYAPPDSTLPEPWKGLIDGSTGVLYYWNPETNVTQYEKPTAGPPVPSGPPPVPSAPKSASASSQPNGIPGQQMPPQQMFPTPEQQMPPQQGNNLPQSYQFPHQQMHYMGYQPNMAQQSGQPGQTPPIGGQPGQTTQYGGSQFNMQQPNQMGQPFGQLQQSSVDYQQHGPKFQNQMGQPLIHGQQPNAPPVGSNDHYFNAKNGGPGPGPGPAMAHHQPKLAAIPMARNQPEMISGGPLHQNVSPSLHGGPPSHNMYGQPTGGPQPYMSNPMMRPNPAVMPSPDAMNLSSVDIYRQKHDVTATGDNVPAPFMSFESTGFPPELLREVRYLFQKRSTCRTLPLLFSHTYGT